MLDVYLLQDVVYGVDNWLGSGRVRWFEKDIFELWIFDSIASFSPRESSIEQSKDAPETPEAASRM